MEHVNTDLRVREEVAGNPGETGAHVCAEVTDSFTFLGGVLHEVVAQFRIGGFVQDIDDMSGVHIGKHAVVLLCLKVFLLWVIKS